jgi:hypothetical protein
MRRLIVFAVLINLAACTTLRPIEGTSSELQSRISSGGLLAAGDRVLIVTTDEKMHKFRVRGLSAGIIEGRRDRVPVDQLASLQKRQFSRAKTWILVGCGVAFTGLIVYAAANAAPAFALSGAP